MAIDVERLLAEISPEAPCGEDLSYDPALMELERVAQGTPEQQVGDTIVPAEEPNWRDVRNKALELSARTRSLTVLKYLVVSALETEGLAGLADSLAVLRGSLERYWETLWPQLDPDDAYDPLERMNIISFLSPPPGVYGDPIQFLQRLAKTPLCNSKQLGSYSYRDIQIARGEITPSADGEPANVSSIEAAFRDTATEDLDATAAAAQQAADHLAAIDAAITERVGADRAANLDAAHKAMKDILAAISAMSGGLAGVDADLSTDAPAGAAGGSAGGSAPAGAAGPAISGEIRSAEDVIRVLDQICNYYQRTEPSSPVPLLLRRARGLVRKSFVEIIQDLNPEAIHQIEMISGPLGDLSQGQS